jgi:hypothetical protein
LRCSGRWTETGEAIFLESIGDAGDQRYLRTDYGQANCFGPGEIDQSFDILRIDGDVTQPGFERRTSVTGRDEDLIDTGALRALPCERVFSASTTND